MYIGMLFLPIDKKKDLLNELLLRRCIQNNSWNWSESNCLFKCGYHDKNNTEIHYETLPRSNARFRIAYRWLDDFLIKSNNLRNKKLVYFNILGLNLTRMDLQTFGDKKAQDLTIYNRFFRTTLKGGIKYFFSDYDKIIIKEIFHDKGGQESHKYFPWYTGYKINVEKENKLFIENEDINFIDSDHRVYTNSNNNYKNESQLIQFIDLILGSLYCCLHNPAERKEKKDIGIIMKPLIQRILNNPRNKNSRYNYYRKQAASFFPINKITDLNEIYKQLDFFGSFKNNKNYPNNFYTKRPIFLLPKTQQTLF
jgi:hypothetical protein